MDKYRILKTYCPRSDQWGYSLQRIVVTRRLFRKPKIEWISIYWGGVYTIDLQIAIKWHQLYKADIFEEDPANRVITLIYSEPKRLFAEGMPKPLMRPTPPAYQSKREGDTRKNQWIL